MLHGDVRVRRGLASWEGLIGEVVLRRGVREVREPQLLPGGSGAQLKDQGPRAMGEG